MNFYVWCGIIAVIIFLIACCIQSNSDELDTANFLLSLALIVGFGLPIIKFIYTKVEKAQKKAQEEEERKRRAEATNREQQRKENAEEAFELMKTGSLNEVKDFLESKEIDINVKNDYGLSLLHYAAGNNNNVEVLKYLISLGMDINERDNYRGTSLHCAAAGNTKNIVEFLVQQGADIYAVGKFEETPFHVAVCANPDNVEIIKYFVSLGMDVNIKSKRYSETPLMMAAQSLRSNVESLKCLISLGAKVNEKNEVGATALHYAAQKNSKAVVELLVQSGADIYAKLNDGGSTPFHLAAGLNPDVEIIKYFVSLGMDVNIKADKLLTPLHMAAGNNPNIEVLKTLLNLGADKIAKTEDYNTAYNYAQSLEKDESLLKRKRDLLM